MSLLAVYAKRNHGVNTKLGTRNEKDRPALRCESASVGITIFPTITLVGSGHGPCISDRPRRQAILLLATGSRRRPPKRGAVAP